MRRVLFAFTGIAAAVFIMAIGGVDNVVRSQSSLPAPTGVSAVNGDNHGEAVVSWQAVADAAYYRIGWMADEDYQAAGSGAESGYWSERVPLLQRRQPGTNLSYDNPAHAGHQILDYRRQPRCLLRGAAMVILGGSDACGGPDTNTTRRRFRRPGAGTATDQLTTFRWVPLRGDKFRQIAHLRGSCGRDRRVLRLRRTWPIFAP